MHENPRLVDVPWVVPIGLGPGEWDLSNQQPYQIALDALEASGIAYAILHDGDKLASGIPPSGDIDIAVGSTGLNVLCALRPVLKTKDLYVLGLIERAIESWWLFVADPQIPGNPIHLDLVQETTGKGTYGLRFEVLLRDRVRGDRWVVAAPLDSDLFVLRKRYRKRQWHQIDRLVARMHRAWTTEELVPRIEALFVPSIAGEIRALLDGTIERRPVSWHERIRWHVNNMARYRRRLTTAAGLWVHVAAPRFDVEVFGRRPFTPVRLWNGRGHRTLTAYATQLRAIANARWRGEIAITTGVKPAWLTPDIYLDAEDRLSADAIFEKIEKATIRRQLP